MNGTYQRITIYQYIVNHSTTLHVTLIHFFL